MIRNDDEYLISFTRDQIREAAGEYRREGNVWGRFDADLTDEQCDDIAEQLAGLFEDEFGPNVRNAEV